MESALFSVVVFLLVSLLLLCLVLLFASLRSPKLVQEDMPACDRVEPVNKKDLALLKDLQTVCEKNELQVFPRVSLGKLVKPSPRGENAARWAKYLREQSVDFVICDKEKCTLKLVVLQDGGGEQTELVKTACEKAKVPVMVLRDYNLAGLEKAILTKTKVRRVRRGEDDADLMQEEEPRAV